MKISQDFKTFHLHDGVMNAIEYQPDNKVLILTLELADTSPPELGSTGQMIFNGVEQLSADPPLEDINWVNDVWGEIDTGDHIPDQDIGTLEAMLWYIRLYRRGRSYTEAYMLHLRFVAESFEWIPDK
jgi:hypothetical protein